MVAGSSPGRPTSEAVFGCRATRSRRFFVVYDYAPLNNAATLGRTPPLVMWRSWAIETLACPSRSAPTRSSHPTSATRASCMIATTSLGETGWMTASGIPSARRKLERALFHADALRAEVDAFRAQDPYDFDMKSLGNAPGESDFRVVVKVARSEPVPESWALMTGDFLTNARAVLDHAIFHHVRAQNPTMPSHRIQYPILDNARDFASKVSGRFSANVLRFIEDAQPYQSSDPSGHPFRILRDLVNIDKHRDLVVANYSVGEFEITPNDLFEIVSTKAFVEAPMVPGTTVARAHLRLVQKVKGTCLMEFPCNVRYRETIEIPGMADPGGLLQAIECVKGALGPHLDDLEAAGC